MAVSNFLNCLDFVWRPENDGQPYHVDAHDPGKGTNMGVTEQTWADAVRDRLVSGTLSRANRGDLGIILKTLYWKPCQCDSLAEGMDLVLFNMAMLSGPGEAERLFQQVLGVKVDGIIGPVTLAKANSSVSRDLILTLTNRDESFFATLPGAKYFDHGWDRRAEDCRKEALLMVQG